MWRPRALRWAALALLLTTASPAAASDFTPLRVFLFATYYTLAFFLWVALYLGLRVNKGAHRADPVGAAVAAMLFAPSAAWTPNHFIALPVVLVFGSSLDRPFLTVASFAATGAAVWALLHLTALRVSDAS